MNTEIQGQPAPEPSESAKRLLREDVVYKTVILDPTPHEIPEFSRVIDQYGQYDDVDAVKESGLGSGGSAQQRTPEGSIISTGRKTGIPRTD